MATEQKICRRDGALGVHSIDHFALEVPDLKEAQRFYDSFGLDVRQVGAGLELYSFGDGHRWAKITRGKEKRLKYLCFGAFAEDLDGLEAQLDLAGVRRMIPPQDLDNEGIWFEGFDGLPINVRIAGKVSPDKKSEFDVYSAKPGESGAIANSKAPKVQPRRLSHFGLFTSDVDRALDFYNRTLGLRLSDRSGPLIAFLHGAHGSDHHLLALLSSDRTGMHHVSWDVGSVQEVGLGMAQMTRDGFEMGWGIGRHVLGANYFYYARDPWGSYSEYSADMDYIPHDKDWPAADHAPEDSMFLWGPKPPSDFIQNFESVFERETSPMSQFVLMHGGGMGGWTWKFVRSLLADAGHQVFTPTFTGFGERSHLIDRKHGNKTHITDIVNVLHYEDLRDVILVAHSYAGTVAPGIYAEAGERIRAIVFLDALVAFSGERIVEMMGFMQGDEARALDALLDRGEGPVGSGVQDQVRLMAKENPHRMAPEREQWLLDHLSDMPLRSTVGVIEIGAETLEKPVHYVAAKYSMMGKMHERARLLGWNLYDNDYDHAFLVGDPEGTVQTLLTILNG